MLGTRRGGRIQVTALQFDELVNRVIQLEHEVSELKKPKPSVSRVKTKTGGKNA